MGDDVDIKVLKKTQDTLGTIIKKPPLLEKYLKKPPFRYLFDIIVNVNKVTRFLDGLYTDEELVFENVKDKERKIEFLQKAIDVVGWVIGEPLSAKASKIVAGHEPQKTNEFLQALGQAINKKMDSKEAIKKVLAGEKPQKKSSEPSNEKKNQQEGKEAGSKAPSERLQKKPIEQSNEKRNQQLPRNRTREDKSQLRTQKPAGKTTREVQRRDKGAEDKAKEEKLKKEISPEENKSQNNNESATSDHRESEKSTPISSKDRTSSTPKSSPIISIPSKPGTSSNSKGKPEEPNKKAFTSSPGKHSIASPKSSPIQSPSKPTSGNRSATGSPTSSHPKNSHQPHDDSGSGVGDHPEKSHQSEEGPSSRPRTASSRGKEGSKMKRPPSSIPQTENEIPDEEQRMSVSRPPPPSTDPSRPFSTSRHITSIMSANSNAQQSSTATVSQDTSSRPTTSLPGSDPPASARPRSGILRSARPASARLAPPKVKVRHRVENPEEDSRLNSAKTTVANVILDSSAAAENEEDDTDDTFLVEEEPLPRIPESNSEYVDADLENEGLLMKQILESKKMLEGGSQLPTERKKTEIDKSELIEQSSGRELKELGVLRELIQAVSRRAAPLGRMLDYLQEDVDSMSSELTGWRTEHAQNLAMLSSQDKSTEALLAPLQAELEELDVAVSDQMEAISTTRGNILRNEQRINRMLASLRPS